MKALTSYPNPHLRPAFDSSVDRPTLWYRLLRRIAQVGIAGFWRLRVFDRRYEPTEGGVVYICNHQSFLDPPLVGMALRRPMHYMARDTLFDIPVLGRLISSVNSFPVRRASADIAAVKEAMRRLTSGAQIIVFAEGRRTDDGRIGPFLPGASLLCQRAAQWIVPTLIEGAFDVWPRSRALPGPGEIIVRFARPIRRSEARKCEPTDFLRDIRRTIIEMQADVRRRVGWPPLEYD